MTSATKEKEKAVEEEKPKLYEDIIFEQLKNTKFVQPIFHTKKED